MNLEERYARRLNTRLQQHLGLMLWPWGIVLAVGLVLLSPSPAYYIVGGLLVVSLTLLARFLSVRAAKKLAGVNPFGRSLAQKQDFVYARDIGMKKAQKCVPNVPKIA